jgi:hypothetical protein
MLLNALQHMRLAKLLRRKARNVPMSRKGRYLAFAALHEALARHQAKNPNLSPRNQQLRRRKDREL